MKKIIIMIAIMAIAMSMFAGCGKKEEVAAEEIQTVIYETVIYEDVIEEETILEEVITQETVEETTYDYVEEDGYRWGYDANGRYVYMSIEYWEELEFNSQENPW